jgi:hypothetical protein
MDKSIKKCDKSDFITLLIEKSLKLKYQLNNFKRKKT